MIKVIINLIVNLTNLNGRNLMEKLIVIKRVIEVNKVIKRVKLKNKKKIEIIVLAEIFL